MSSAYSVTLVPLGVSQTASARESWRIFAVCLPQPEKGQAPIEVVDRHPLLRGASFELEFLEPHQPPQKLATSVVSPGNLELLKSIMKNATLSQGSDLDNDSVVGNATPTNDEHFVDVDSLYESQCRQHVQNVLGLLHDPGRSGRPTRIPSDFASWDSYRARLAALDSQEWTKVKTQGVSLAERYRAIFRPNPSARISTAEGFNVTQSRIVMAILQTPAMAKKTGLIVELSASFPRSFGSDSLRGVLSLRFDDQVQAQTYTRRRPLSDGGYFVEPGPSSDDSHPTTLLAQMRRPDKTSADQSVPMYRFYSFNLDHAIVRSVLTPSDPSMDNTSKYANQQAAKGLQPFVGGSVVLTGPVEDLVSKANGNVLPACDPAAGVHCLETLWDGYRMDVASEDPQRSHGFHSIHQHRRSFIFGVMEPLVFNDAEDCIYRLQQVKSVDGPVVHPALYGWDGTGTFESLPWAAKRAPPDPEVWNVDYCQRKSGTPAATLPRLEYGVDYAFRLRNVFQGGLMLISGTSGSCRVRGGKPP